MKKKRFSDFLGNDKTLFLISFLFAVRLWGYVVIYVNNQHTTTIRDVPINLQYRQTVYQSMGLDIIESDINSVNVTVTGPRNVTGSLTKDDIIIYPNITGINGRGKYTFALTADKTSSVKNFTINSLSNSDVTIRLDNLVSREFNVGINISSIAVDGQCMADKPTANPATVTISGPEYKISQINKIEAVTILSETITQTSIIPARLVIYDENGAEMDTNLLTFSQENFDVTIPVMREVVLPVRVEYVNVPSGFDTSILHQSLSISQIRLAVPANVASSLTEQVVGYIDLATLETDKPYTFDLSLPTGYRSMDEVSQITATVSATNLVEKKISVAEIKVINDTTDNIQVLTEVINNVIVVGEKDVVEALRAGSVIAQIDASRLELAQGQQTVEVHFIIPSTDAAYVKGNYTVSIRN